MINNVNSYKVKLKLSDKKYGCMGYFSNLKRLHTTLISWFTNYDFNKHVEIYIYLDNDRKKPIFGFVTFDLENDKNYQNFLRKVIVILKSNNGFKTVGLHKLTSLHIGNDKLGNIVTIERYDFLNTRRRVYNYDKLSEYSKDRVIRLAFGSNWPFYFVDTKGNHNFYYGTLRQIMTLLYDTILGKSKTVTKIDGAKGLYLFLIKFPDMVSLIQRSWIDSLVWHSRPGSFHEAKNYIITILKLLPQEPVLEEVKKNLDIISNEIKEYVKIFDVDKINDNDHNKSVITKK